MPTSTSELAATRAVDVKVTDDALTVQLEDGRTLAVPLVWYPRLLHGTKRERARWRFIGRGVGIHWPSLDEDISIDGLLAGRRSGESQHSLKRWFETRTSARPNKRMQPRRARRAAADTQRWASMKWYFTTIAKSVRIFMALPEIGWVAGGEAGCPGKNPRRTIACR